MHPSTESVASNLFKPIHHKNRLFCTDHVWLVIFWVLWLAMLVIAYFGVEHADYLAIINGYDSFGNTCGVKNNKPFSNFILSGTDTSNKPYLLFMGYTNLSHVVKICVEKCISEIILMPTNLYEEHEKFNSHLCRYDFKMKLLAFSMVKEFNDVLGPCPDVPCDESFAVKHRCIPLTKNRREFLESYEFISIGSSPIALFFTHVYQAWAYMLGLAVFAIVMSAALLFLMQWKTKATIRVFFCLAFLSILAVCITVWIIVLRMPPVVSDMFFDFREEEEGRVLHNFLKDFNINKTASKAIAVFSLLLAEGLLIILVFTWADIPRVTVLCDEAVKCCKQLPNLIVVALTTLMAMMLFFAYWTYIMLCSSTASFKQLSPMGDRFDYRYDPFIKLRLFHQVTFIEVAWVRNCCWVYIFGFVWTCEFICGCQRFWLEMTVTNWYFQTTADWSLLKKHMGSVARGALMGSLVVPRLVLSFLCKLLDNCSAAASLQIGLKTMERQLLIFPGMYAIVGIRNVELCTAAEMARTIMETATDDVKDIRSTVQYTFLSAYLLITNFTFLLGLLLLNDVHDLYFYIAPVCLSTVFAFYVARILLSTIEVALNTLYLCVCEDKQVNRLRGRWSRQNFIQFCIGSQLDLVI